MFYIANSGSHRSGISLGSLKNVCMEQRKLFYSSLLTSNVKHIKNSLPPTDDHSQDLFSSLADSILALLLNRHNDPNAEAEFNCYLAGTT